MAGTDTIRGIAYQQAHAIHCAIDLVDRFPRYQLRVEGMADVVDIEILDEQGQLVRAQQVKSREGSQWTPKPIADVMRRWAALDAPHAEFTFVTNGELGPGAQKLHELLADDGPERHARIAEVLDIDKTIAERLNSARIRVDPSSVGALLAFAERRIASLLDPLERDIETVAGQRIDRLFSILTQRAAHNEPEQRLLSATELRALVGGTYGERPEFQWRSTLRATFMSAVDRTTPHLVPLTLDRVNDSTLPVNIDSLIGGSAASLSGATGTGKSSVVEMAQASAAAVGRAVVVCRAETYTPGHLDALVADSLGFTLNTAVPTYVGRQVLADPDSVLIIDGVSEIPDAAAERLAEELSSLLTRQGLISVVVVGRDPVVLRRVLAPAGAVVAFTVSPLQDTTQARIVDNVVSRHVAPTDKSHILQRAARALGDGVRSPMLLTIYLEAAGEASSELSRAEVYEQFVARLSERAPTINAKCYLPILGAVFAKLLADQRRYSDRYEWILLTDGAATSFSSPVGGTELRDAALKMGLVSELGATGIITPFHDSIADYLAATAVAAGFAVLPSTLRDSHSELVLFACELGVDVSDDVVRQLPFLSVRAAREDRPFPDSSGFAIRIEALLDTLLGKGGCTVSATETLDGRWMIQATGAEDVALGTVVIDAGRGPLYAAVRIWRIVLRARVSAVKASLSRKPANTEDARTLVTEFVRARQNETSALLETFPPEQRSRLLEKLRPLGLSFYIGEPQSVWDFEDWPMTYVASVETRVLTDEPGERAGRTAVSHLLEGGPARSAASDVLEAIEQLVDQKGWLA